MMISCVKCKEHVCYVENLKSVNAFYLVCDVCLKKLLLIEKAYNSIKELNSDVGIEDMSGCHDTNVKCSCACHVKCFCGCKQKEEDYLPMAQQMQRLEEKIKKLESHISKLHDMINLEDRITAKDVISRLFCLEEHKQRQIDENRAVSKKLDEIENIASGKIQDLRDKYDNDIFILDQFIIRFLDILAKVSKKIMILESNINVEKS